MAMMITKDQLKAWGACADGYRWFLEKFPAGEADYQAVLDALAADDRPNDANWLMDRAGADSTAVLEVEAIADTKHLFFAGRIVIAKGVVLSGALRAGLGIKAGLGIEAGEGIKAGLGIEAGEGIKAGLGIEAGEGIEAGWGIKAGEGIEAGWGIKAGEGIEAGEGWACFAGLRIRVARWGIGAKVIAKTKPVDLHGGHWVETVIQEASHV